MHEIRTIDRKKYLVRVFPISAASMQGPVGIGYVQADGFWSTRIGIRVEGSKGESDADLIARVWAVIEAHANAARTDEL